MTPEEEVNIYEHSVRLWQRIYHCFPRHLSTAELQTICDEFCGQVSAPAFLIHFNYEQQR
jgi:hypothetical protein